MSVGYIEAMQFRGCKLHSTHHLADGESLGVGDALNGHAASILTYLVDRREQGEKDGREQQRLRLAQRNAGLQTCSARRAAGSAHGMQRALIPPQRAAPSTSESPGD